MSPDGAFLAMCVWNNTVAIIPFNYLALGDYMAVFSWKSYVLPLIPSGTIEGTVIVLGSKDMRTLITVKKAHLGIVTTLCFSQDSRLVSSFYFS